MTDKVMLAFKLDSVDKARLPALVSPKLDGIRCTILGGVPFTRSLKDIPNLFIRNALKAMKLPHGLDGELIVGPPNDKDVYRNTVSGVMSQDGEPDWCFHVFDLKSDMPFTERLLEAKALVAKKKSPRLKLVPHQVCRTHDEIDRWEAEYLSRGYEGLMGRSTTGLYKQGRSGKTDMALWKLKRFEDAEAMIIGFDERMHNANEAKRNALGRTERSSHKENMKPTGTLGALKVRGMSDQFGGVEFDVGTGFTDAERQEIWDNRDEWLGKVIKYKFLPIGVKDKPRHPVYLGLRGDL
jgi:DNA ligase 1